MDTIAKRVAAKFAHEITTASALTPLEEAQKGDMVEIEVGSPWPSSSTKEKVTGKVVRVRKDGVLTVDVGKSRSNPGGHSNEDVAYVDVHRKKSAAGQVTAEVPKDINLPRLERIVASIEKEAKDMRVAFEKYKHEPERMKPQLQNMGHGAHILGNDVRVLLRTLGEEE